MGKTRIWRMWPMEPLPEELSVGCSAAQFRRGGMSFGPKVGAFEQDRIDREEAMRAEVDEALAKAAGGFWPVKFHCRRMQFRRPDAGANDKEES